MNCFIKEKKGSYKGINFFCSITLVWTKEWDSWSDNDYDDLRTNYVSIVTSDEINGEIPVKLLEAINNLSERVNAPILEDT